MKRRSINAPGTPVYVPQDLRGLMGDSRIALPQGGPAVQLIDAEFPTVQALALIGEAVEESGLIIIDGIEWTITTGVERASLAEVVITNTELNRVVVARSVSVKARNLSAQTLTVRALVCPATVVAPIGDFIGMQDPKANTADVSGVSQVVVPVLFGRSERGMTIYNNSAANLFLALDDPNVNTTNNFTVRLVPNAYYETPFGVDVQVFGIWDAAGAGVATTTIVRD